MADDAVSRGVEAVARRTGLTSDAVAILAIVLGVVVLVFPVLVQYVLGVLLIAAGILWLVRSRQGRAPPAP